MSENAEIEEWLRSLPDMFTAQSIADNLREETKSSECSPAQDRTFVDFLSKEIKEYREELETKLQRLKRLEEGVAIRSTVSCYIKQCNWLISSTKEIFQAQIAAAEQKADEAENKFNDVCQRFKIGFVDLTDDGLNDSGNVDG